MRYGGSFVNINYGYSYVLSGCRQSITSLDLYIIDVVRPVVIRGIVVRRLLKSELACGAVDIKQGHVVAAGEAVGCRGTFWVNGGHGQRRYIAGVAGGLFEPADRSCAGEGGCFVDVGDDNRVGDRSALAILVGSLQDDFVSVVCIGVAGAVEVGRIGEVQLKGACVVHVGQGELAGIVAAIDFHLVDAGAVSIDHVTTGNYGRCILRLGNLIGWSVSRAKIKRRNCGLPYIWPAQGQG